MRITKFVLALAVGATATIVRADSPNAATPALPLPEISSSWNTSAAPSGVVSTSYDANTPSDQEPQGTVVKPTTPPPVPSPATDDQAAPNQPMPGETGSSCTTEPSCSSTPSCGCNGNSYGSGCPCCCNPWYGYAGGLIMTRLQSNKYWTTYNEINNNDQILNTDNASARWAGGGEFTVGRCFGCDNRIEATYWGIWQMTGAASVTSATNQLGTPMDTTNGGVMIGTQTADSFFTNAHEALIQRNDQVNNVEINWSYNPTAADCGCGLSSTWLAGFRYFRFDEDLLWTSVAGNYTYGEDGGADQANLEIRAKNDLAGFQVGNRLDWKLCNCFGIYFGTKAGIYGNDATTTSSLYSGSGVSGFSYSGHKDTVAFIGQADLGLNYDFNCRWSATLGYRVVVASGIALADNQIPFYLAGQDDFEDVKTNGDLILHGGFAGVQFRW